MYTVNHPLTGELVNIYADNVPFPEGTVLDNAYPVRKQHTVVAREERYYTTRTEKIEDKIIYDPENYNDVIDVIVENPVVKAEDGKIDAEALFQLILERPLEEVSPEANVITYVSEEEDVVSIDEEGNLTANVELGQTYVVCSWPSGVSVRLLVTVGEVSEIVNPNAPIEEEEVEEAEEGVEEQTSDEIADNSDETNEEV